MNKKNKLFHIGANQYSPLPAEHHTRRIWEELSQAFDEYHVLGRSFSWRASRTSSGNLTLHLLPSLSRYAGEFLFTSWFLIYFIFKYKPTHLLVQCPVMGGLCAALLSRLLGLPLFVELHGNHYFAPVREGLKGVIEFRIYKTLAKFAFAAATHIRTLSDDMSTQLCKTYGAKLSSKIIMIPTRVDLSVFCEAKSNYIVADKLKLVTVGSLSPRKNHINLIKDLACNKIPFILTIVGEGALADEYLHIIKQLNIENQVVLAGNMKHHELAKLLLAQDIYIHYSLSEGLPRAILEAMAIGLPVITSPVGFIKGIFLNGQNSIVLEEPLSNSLSHKLPILANSEELRRHLGINAKKLIEKDFNAEHVFKKYRAAILNMNKPSPRFW